MKKESLADRLIRVCEEKAKLEYENQKLRVDCTAWQNACSKKDANFKLMFEAWDKADNDKTEVQKRNSELRAWQHLTELLFERCGMFIVKNSRMLGINDYLIKELGLNQTITDIPEEFTDINASLNNDDILSLFKQSSNHI